ncbi:MAG: ABC transporter permease [Kiritimatiellia bacterium]
MNRILSIAAVTLRSAIRSRIVVFMMLLLVFILVGIPPAIRGDGTLTGYVQVLLSYTLGFAGIILSIVAVWTGCTAVSAEIKTHQLDMVVTKPVPAIQIWLGKWLGILVLSFVLLLFTFGSAYGGLRWAMTRRAADQKDLQKLREQVLVAREQIPPREEGLAEQADNLLAVRQAEGGIPEGLTAAAARRVIEDNLRLQANSVPGGYSRQWIFDIGVLPANRPLFLRYTFSAPRDDIEGMWLAGARENRDQAVRRVTETPGGFYTWRIPPAAVNRDGTLPVEYGNINSEPVTVIFPPEKPPMLLFYHDSFEMNFLRVFLVVLVRIAMLSAIGLTAGTLFSQPVALFFSAWIVLLLNVGRYIQSMAATQTFFQVHDGPVRVPGLLDKLLHLFFAALDRMLHPLQSPDVLGALAAGEWVSWATVAVEAAVKILIFSGLLALLSAFVLNRREVGLPS